MNVTQYLGRQSGNLFGKDLRFNEFKPDRIVCFRHARGYTTQWYSSQPPGAWLPMNNPVELELRSLKQDASSEEHGFSYARTSLKLTTFRHAWEGACSSAKISGLRFHDLRHTFATRLRAKGVHEMDLMSWLGHTTLQMTARYTHATPQNLRTAVDSLNKRPLAFRPRSVPRSRQVATGTDGM